MWFNNPSIQNALSIAAIPNRRRMNAQLETAGYPSPQHQYENRQRQSKQMTNVGRILSRSGRLRPVNLERLSLASQGLQTALKPNVERYLGRLYFENTGLFNGNTSNAIIRRLRTAVRGGGRTNVRDLLNQLNGETIRVQNNTSQSRTSSPSSRGGTPRQSHITVTKKKILNIELNSGISDLNHAMYMHNRGGGVSPVVKSRYIRAFIARYGNLTPHNLKLIVPNINNHKLRLYRKLRRYKGPTWTPPRRSRRQRGLPALHSGLMSSQR